jgi:hypothetical protein
MGTYTDYIKRPEVPKLFGKYVFPGFNLIKYGKTAGNLYTSTYQLPFTPLREPGEQK